MNTQPHLQNFHDDEFSKRLIEKLKGIETRYSNVWKERKRRRGERRRALRGELNNLEKEWVYVKRLLHSHFRPLILKRDGYKCRVCGSSEKLELARLFWDSLALLCRPPQEQMLLKYSGPYRTPEERYSEKNMFTLCKKCHIRFDSFHGRRWRMGPKAISSVEEAVEVLRNKYFLEDPPYLIEHWKKYKEEIIRTELLILVNALGKVAAFKQQNDLKKARRHLGVARRQLTFYLKNGFLEQNQYEQFMRKLQLVRVVLDSGGRFDEILDEIRRGVLEAVRTKVSPDFL
ncbi:MAG: HNH endonuclease [Candidatus Bathyarchaeota archaeon]|nr:HNH endonuclease [Candidatus Bathyarchaeota archaeon]